MNETLKSLDKEMNNEIMLECFTYDGEKRFKKGYFAGLKIIEKLVNNNEDIKKLTFKNTDEILNLFFKTTKYFVNEI